MNSVRIGEKLRKARTKLKLSQLQVARQVDLSRATIIAVEQGKTLPRYDKMVRLTKLLQIEE